MDKKKKIILGVLAVGAVAFIFKDKLFPAADGTSEGSKSIGPNSGFEGRVLKLKGGPPMYGYKVLNGVRVGYTSSAAYEKDGRLPIFEVDQATMDSIPEDWYHVISETGYQERVL